jgi:hypothetical protein
MMLQGLTNNMGCITAKEIENFATFVLGKLGIDGNMKWTSSGNSWCDRQHKTIYIGESFIGKYPWQAKENVLHEIAHIYTDDKFHSEKFYAHYTNLVARFLAGLDKF